MKSVEVFDNFFSEEIHNEIDDLMFRPKWILTGGEHPSRFWHMDNLEEEEYFNTFLFKKICEKLNVKVKGFNRIYANGQTAGQSGVPHIDDGDLTFLYYPNRCWDLTWQGHLIFIEDDEPNHIVAYKPNRAVLFPGDILHYAQAPDRMFAGLRVSLAYKLFI